MIANGLSLNSGTNFIVPTSAAGTPVNGTIRLNGNSLQIFYNTVWINLC
jgi:hypothetical protein